MSRILVVTLVLGACNVGKDDDEVVESLPPGDDSPDETGWVDSTDSQVYTGPTEIDSITYNCDNLGWWYDLYSVGWMYGAELYIYQTGASPPWDEFHNFPSESYNYDPNGWWDNYYLELDHVEAYADVIEGSTTLYDCTDSRRETLTWVVVVYDEGGSRADCGTWGDDPGYGEGQGCQEL